MSYCCMMDFTVSMTCSGMAVHVYITLDTGMSQAFCLVFGSHTQYKRSRMYSARSFVSTELTILPNHPLKLFLGSNRPISFQCILPL